MEKKKVPQTIDWITINMLYNGEEKYLKQSTELQWIGFTMEKKNTSNNRLNYNEYALQWRRKIPQTIDWITMNYNKYALQKRRKIPQTIDWITMNMLYNGK